VNTHRATVNVTTIDHADPTRNKPSNARCCLAMLGFCVGCILLKHIIARCRTRCHDMWVWHRSMFVLHLLEVYFRTRSLKILSENIFVFLAHQEACCSRRFRHKVSRACFYWRKPYSWFGNMLHISFKNMLLVLKLSSSPCSSKAI
jgi:hypothetical protein